MKERWHTLKAMFTGIVEEIGKLISISGGMDECSVRVGASKVLEGTVMGDSIAVNGVCLTVVRIGQGFFEVDVSRETMSRTSLKGLSPGAPLNLERALRLEDRLGGHIVTGHIDGTGKVLRVEKAGSSFVYEISAERSIISSLVEKGSVTVEGVSLTIASLAESSFTVSVIPHTRASTDLRDKNSGDIVNLECDIIGKYVLRYMSTGMQMPVGAQEGRGGAGVTESLLLENGFM